MLANVIRLCQHPLAVSAPRRGGSRVGKAQNKDMHRQAGALLLDSEYFTDNATHMTKDFRRRFTNNELFMKIVFGLREYGTYFMCKKDCPGLWGFSSVQKYMAAMLCLAYEAPADATDDYLRMTESRCFETFTMFCRAAMQCWARLFEGAK
ncbi:uncharacterized protein [Lolium perenne]|uniref:uncharacterized protein n=1 Tax=Lolium perenne TaxID=4522 RepID=UPI0021F5D792|nr:uncharacterized protein LOC127316257 [Lolium perenne]